MSSRGSLDHQFIIILTVAVGKGVSLVSVGACARELPREVGADGVGAALARGADGLVALVNVCGNKGYRVKKTNSFNTKQPFLSLLTHASCRDLPRVVCPSLLTHAEGLGALDAAGGVAAAVHIKAGV